MTPPMICRELTIIRRQLVNCTSHPLRSRAFVAVAIQRLDLLSAAVKLDYAKPGRKKGSTS